MLKPVLLANATSCAIFGLIFVLQGPETSAFLGDPPVLLVQILGAGLIANAVLLIATAFQSQPSRNNIMMFVYGDAAWVAATALLLILGIWITTSTGAIWSLGVAAFVGLCAWLQWRHAPG